jgi:hypothetical protein
MDWEECIWDAYHCEDEDDEDDGARIAFDFDKDDYLHDLQAELEEKETESYVWGY